MVVPGPGRVGFGDPEAMGRTSVKKLRRPGSHEAIVRLDETIFSCRKNKLTSTVDIRGSSFKRWGLPRQVDSFGKGVTS